MGSKSNEVEGWEKIVQPPKDNLYKLLKNMINQRATDMKISVSELTSIVFDISKAHQSLADNIKNSLEATKSKKNLHMRININCSKLSKQYLRAFKCSRKAVSSRKRASSSKHSQYWLISSLKRKKFAALNSSKIP
uniref:Uncharacterized protein n=1 Tax=Glossina palpalis gambiensis TaxID=67801 RepID=A0A1B0B369_9MUSC